MSHPMYNPYASGNQRQGQGQYGSANVNQDRDPRRAATNLPFNPSGAASTSANPLGMPPLPMFSQSMSYRPEASRAAVDNDMEKSIDMHISRAREEARLLGKPMPQSVSQAPYQINAQRDELFPSSSGRSSYSMSARPTDTDSSITGSLSWLSNLTRSSTADSSSFFPSTAASSYTSSSESQKDRCESVIPGLGDYLDTDEPAPRRQEPVQQISNTKYSAESAANILRHFNLEKEDLEHLIAYPENEITPDNLPLILRKIRIEKNRKAAATAPAYQEPLPKRTVTGIDNLSSSWASEGRQAESSILKSSKVPDYGQKDTSASFKPSSSMDYAKDIPPIPSKVLDFGQKDKAPSVLQQSKVIDYGHTGKYMGGFGDNMGTVARAIQGIMKFDTSYLREPLPSTTSSAKTSGSLVSSSREQASPAPSFGSFSSSLSSATPSSHDPSGKPSNQAPKTLVKSFNIPKQDTDLRLRKPEAFKEVEEGKQISKTHPSNAPLRTGIVLVDSIKKPKSHGQVPAVQEQVKKLPQQAKPQQQPTVSHVIAQKPSPRQVLMSANKPATQVTTASPIPTITSGSSGRPLFMTPSPQPSIIPSLPQNLPLNMYPLTPANKQPQPAAKITTCKGLPTAAMMQDYAAASPRVFPHTCCLCVKECSHMKDWIAHQNTALHLENCKLLCRKFPEWDGEIKLPSSPGPKEVRPSSQSAAYPPRTRRGSRSRSRSSSPRRHHDSDRRDKRRSRSRSPHRYSRRSRSHSPPSTSRRHRSRSRSHERDLPLRPDEGRHDDRRLSPRRRDDRRPSPRRTDEKRPPPRRSDERKLSPQRSRERRHSSPRSYDRRPSPRKSEEKWSEMIGSRERRSSSDKRSSDRSSTPKMKPSAAEQMAKKLLEKSSALRSLTNPSSLDAVVKTLIPALMSEFAKMGSAPVASSSSTAKKKVVKKPGTTIAKKTTLTTSKVSAVKPSTMVRLGAIIPPLSHDDVVAFAEKFGKTKSVLLFRQKHQAVVCFENEEDAKKLRNTNNIQIKEHPVTVVKYKEAVSTSQRKSPPSAAKKPMKPVAKTTTAPNKTSTVKSSNTKKVPAAKPPSTESKTASTAKVLISKARKATTGQISRTAYRCGLKEVFIDEEEAQSSSSSHKQTVKKAPATAPTKKKVEKVTESVKNAEISDEGKAKTQTDKPPEDTLAKKTGEETREMEEQVDTRELEMNKVEDLEIEPIEKSSGMDCEDERPPLESVNVEKPTEQLTVSQDEAPIEKEEAKETAEDTSQSQEMVETNAEKEDLKASEDETVIQETMLTKDDQQTDADLQQKDSSPKAEAALVETENTLPEEEEVLVQEESTVDDNMAKDDIAESEPLQKEADLQKTESNLLQEEASSKEKELLQEDKSTLSQTTTEKGTTEVPKKERVIPALMQLKLGSKPDPEPTQGSKPVPEPTQGSKPDPEPTLGSKPDPEPTLGSKPVPDPTPAAAAPLKAPALTAGESLDKLLVHGAFSFLSLKNVFGDKFAQFDSRLVLISNLPNFSRVSYTVDELVQLLSPFGYQHEDDNIYVIPQNKMAVFRMPDSKCVKDIVTTFVRKPRQHVFKGCTLKLQAIYAGIYMPPMGFYKSLMRMIKKPCEDDGQRTIFINNISASEAAELREKLGKIESVKNYLPLLNKVFVEFESARDADRLGVWHSFLKRSPSYEIHRLKAPHADAKALPPRLAVKAMPDNSERVPGVSVPGANFGIPHGSLCPFWVTMTTKPYLFPTVSPWFIIPDFQTLKTMTKTPRFVAMSQTTIMLTGLPEENYTHEDVARLLWPYFSNKTLESLYYNIIVLPLQRRAFVYFPSIANSTEFVKNYKNKPVSLKSHPLHVHYVLQKMPRLSTEEKMYDTFIKLSNTRAPDLQTLEKRLLCVSISEASPDVIRMVMEVVGSVAPVLSFLPLANRICIELADDSDIPKVMDKVTIFRPDYVKKQVIWSKATCFEPLSSFKQRLRDSGNTVINLDQSTADKTVKNETPAPASSDNSAQLETETNKKETDTTIKEEKPKDSAHAAEVTCENAEEKMQLDEDGDKAVTVKQLESEEANLSLKKESSHPCPFAPPKEKDLELPHLNEDIFKILTAAVREHRRSKNQSSDSEQDDKKSQTSDDLRTECISSHDFPFENLSDFVTVDEISDDTSDRSPKHHHSSSSSSSRRSSDPRRDYDKSSSSSERHRTSTRSTRESSKRSSSSSSSSRSNKEHFKSPSSSSSSSSSPRKPSESSKSQSSLSTSSKKSDQKGSDKSAGAESQRKDKEPQDKSLKSMAVVELNEDTVKDLRERNKNRKSKEEEDSERYKILDSVEEQMDNNEIRDNDNEKEEHFQVLDWVDEEGRAEKGVEVLDSVAEEQANQESTELLTQELDTSNSLDKVSVEGKAHVEEKQETRTTRSKRKREEGHEEEQAVHSKTPKTNDKDGAEQETFEILDSIDDQATTEDDQKGEDVSKEEKSNENDRFVKVIDAVEDQPKTDNESESEKSKNRETISLRSTRSGRSAQNEEKERSLKRNERTGRKHETRTKGESIPEISSTEREIVEELEFEIVDAVEEEPTQDEEKGNRRRSKRGKKDDREEAAYEILDSVDDSAANQERSTRSTRERRSRSAKTDSSSDEKSSQKDDTTRRCRATPVRESSIPSKTNKGLKDSEQSAFEILDSVEEEMATMLTTRARKAKTSKSDLDETLSEKDSTPTRQTPSRALQERKTKKCATEGPSKEDTSVSTRSSRARSSKRDSSSDASQKEDTPTRSKRTPARELHEQKIEKSLTKDLPITDVKEMIDEEFEILDAVEDEQPAPEVKAKRGRPRKLPQKTVAKSEKSAHQVSVGEQAVENQNDKLEEIVEQKMAESETCAEELQKNEDEEEPVYEVVDSLEDDQIQDEDMATVDEVTGETLQKTDERVPKEAVTNENTATTEGETAKREALDVTELCQEVSHELVNLEFQKERFESPKERNKDSLEEPDSGIMEQETMEVLDSIEDQTEAEDKQKAENLSEHTSKDTEDVSSKESVLEIERTKRQATKRSITPTTRSTRSGRVCRSEERDKSPKRHEQTGKKYETSDDEKPGMESNKRPTEKHENEQEMATISENMEAVGQKTYAETTALNFDEVSDGEFQVLDSVEDEVKRTEEASPKVKAKRGRPRKEPRKTASKTDDSKTKCQILEAVHVSQSEMIKMEDLPDEQETTKSKTCLEEMVKDEDEEEPLYEIVDSLEDDLDQDEEIAIADKETFEKNDNMALGDEGLPSEQDKTTHDLTTVEVMQKESIVDEVKDGTAVSCQEATNEAENLEMEKTNVETAKVVNTFEKPESGVTEEETYEILDSLEETTTKDDMSKSVEKEGYRVIDSVETQATKTETESDTEKPKKRETRSTRSGRSGRSEEREKSPKRQEQIGTKYETRKNLDFRMALDESGIETKESSNKKDKYEPDLENVSGVEYEGQLAAEEKVKTANVDMNLDAVSDEEEDFPDDAAEEEESLVVLDEIIEEEEEEEQTAVEEVLPAEQSEPVPCSLSQDDRTESGKPETLETSGEACKEEAAAVKEMQDPESSIKRKHEEDTEEVVNFVTVDEVGEIEEEEVKEVETPNTRGRGRKRARKAPVRKSTRGKKVTPKDEEEEQNEPVEPEILPTASSPVVSGENPEKTGDLVEAGPVELGSEMDVTVGSKRRSDLLGPDLKRARSQSPCVSSDAKLPPFRPNNPLGQEFVVPKSGFFCNLCSIFYLNEAWAREKHCSSRRHYENLKNHFQRQSRGSSES